MIRDFATIFLRDLDTLRQEVELYPDDAALWKTIPGLPNSGGTLALHLAGNLRHFIGGVLGETGYVRDRDAEFSTRALSRIDLIALIDAARSEVAKTLQGLGESVLDAAYPTLLMGRSIPTRRFLLHLATHLTYHLGQLDYHRRAATGSPASAGAVSVSALGEPPPRT